MKLVILLVALTSVCATPSRKYGRNPHRKFPVDGEEFKVPVVEIDQNFNEILLTMEQQEEYEDKLNIPIDTPKEHIGLHYIETAEEMQEMGVNPMNINPDLIEDAFLFVVSITENFM